MIASGFACEANDDKLPFTYLHLIRFFSRSGKTVLVLDFVLVADLHRDGWFDWLVAYWFWLMDGLLAGVGCWLVALMVGFSVCIACPRIVCLSSIYLSLV
jgi:hypothetical protein